MRTFICFGIAILSCFYSLGQSSYEHGVPYYPIPVDGHRYVDIQYLEINKNDFLLKEIRKYIQEQADSSILFKSGFGFLVVDNIIIRSNSPYFIKKKLEGENSEDMRFSLGTRSYLLTQSLVTLSSYCTGCFPDFYSIIDNRLILFYTDQTRWLHQGYFSDDSKKKLIDLQRSCLKQSLDLDFVFIDFFDKNFKLSADERKLLTEQEIMMKASLTLQSNKTVIQYLNGQIKYQY